MDIGFQLPSYLVPVSGYFRSSGFGWFSVLITSHFIFNNQFNHFYSRLRIFFVKLVILMRKKIIFCIIRHNSDE